MHARRKKKKIEVPGLPEWLTVARAYQTCDKVMHRKLAEAGLTVPQYDLLMSLMKKDGQTQQELVERRENPEDGRGKVVTLTDTWKRLARRGWKVQAEVVTTMFESMTPREMEQVAQTMNRVRQALEPRLDGGPPGARKPTVAGAGALVYSINRETMSQDGKERRRRVRAAALVELGAELDMLTERMKRLPSADPETFARADAICKVLRRGVEELKHGSLRPPPAAAGSISDT